MENEVSDIQEPQTPRVPFGQDRTTRLAAANKMIRSGALAFFGALAFVLIQVAMHSRIVVYSSFLFIAGAVMLMIGFYRRSKL